MEVLYEWGPVMKGLFGWDPKICSTKALFLDDPFKRGNRLDTLFALCVLIAVIAAIDTILWQVALVIGGFV